MPLTSVEFRLLAWLVLMTVVQARGVPSLPLRCSALQLSISILLLTNGSIQQVTAKSQPQQQNDETCNEERNFPRILTLDLKDSTNGEQSIQRSTRTSQHVQPLVAPNNLQDGKHNDSPEKATKKSSWGWSKQPKPVRRVPERLGNGPEAQLDIAVGSDDEHKLYKISKFDVIPDDCTPQFEWQTHTLCTCNVIHEHADLVRQQLLVMNADYALQGVTNLRNKRKHKRKQLPPPPVKPVVVPEWWYSDQEYHLLYDDDDDEEEWSDEDSTSDDLDSDDEWEYDGQLYLGAGFYRQAWWLRERHWSNQQQQQQEGVVVDYVLKTLHYKDALHYNTRNQERHRRDALVADRLAKSPHTTNIYAYCGNSALYQYAPGGSLQDNILRDIEYHSGTSSSTEEDSSDTSSTANNNKDNPQQHNSSTATSPRRKKIRNHSKHKTPKSPKRYPPHGWSSTKQMAVAWQIVSAISDMHTTDHPQRSAIAHTDISLGQFLDCDYDNAEGNAGELVDYRLNDFNRVRLLYWKQDEQEICPFRVGGHKGRNRSPEEYSRHDENEKEDIYSMGNILYTIVTGLRVFDGKTTKVAQKLIKEGVRSDIDDVYRKSDDILLQALVVAIDKCWIHDPAQRPSAKEIQDILFAAMTAYDEGADVDEEEEEEEMVADEEEEEFEEFADSSDDDDDDDDDQGDETEGVTPDDYLDEEGDVLQEVMPDDYLDEKGTKNATT